MAITLPRQSEPKGIEFQEEEILRAATIHLMMKHGSLFVATGVRGECNEGTHRWIITVTLRYPTGHEGYIGDLLYDGKQFAFLTPDDIRKERARQIEDDPEGRRKWNEYRAPPLPAREA